MKHTQPKRNFGQQKKTLLCYNALIQYKTICIDCERLKDKPRKCNGLDCADIFTPTCMRRFFCPVCGDYNRAHDDVPAAVMGASG